MLSLSSTNSSMSMSSESKERKQPNTTNSISSLKSKKAFSRLPKKSLTFLTSNSSQRVKLDWWLISNNSDKKERTTSLNSISRSLFLMTSPNSRNSLLSLSKSPSLTPQSSSQGRLSRISELLSPLPPISRVLRNPVSDSTRRLRLPSSKKNTSPSRDLGLLRSKLVPLSAFEMKRRL